MSFAPIFETLKVNSGVTALLGANPCRVFPQGEAPQKGAPGYAEPYAVYQQIIGNPENYIGTLPDADNSTTQIDVYAKKAAQARQVAIAIRNAVQPVAYMTSIQELGTDAATGLRRVSMDVDWITNR